MNVYIQKIDTLLGESKKRTLQHGEPSYFLRMLRARGINAYLLTGDKIKNSYLFKSFDDVADDKESVRIMWGGYIGSLKNKPLATVKELSARLAEWNSYEKRIYFHTDNRFLPNVDNKVKKMVFDIRPGALILSQSVFLPGEYPGFRAKYVESHVLPKGYGIKLGRTPGKRPYDVCYTTRGFDLADDVRIGAVRDVMLDKNLKNCIIGGMNGYGRVLKSNNYVAGEPMFLRDLLYWDVMPAMQRLADYSLIACEGSYVRNGLLPNRFAEGILSGALPLLPKDAYFDSLKLPAVYLEYLCYDTVGGLLKNMGAISESDGLRDDIHGALDRWLDLEERKFMDNIEACITSEHQGK